MLEFAPRSEQLLTYDEAVLYCHFLDYNGSQDWRMATYDEYMTNNEIGNWSWYLERDEPDSDTTLFIYAVRDV